MMNILIGVGIAYLVFSIAYVFWPIIWRLAIAGVIAITILPGMLF